MIGIKKFGWVKTPSAWQQAQAWNARRAAFVASERARADTFTSMFQTASQTRLEGQFKLATSAALKRVQMATKAKFDEIAKVDVSILDKKI